MGKIVSKPLRFEAKTLFSAFEHRLYSAIARRRPSIGTTPRKKTETSPAFVNYVVVEASPRPPPQ